MGTSSGLISGGEELEALVSRLEQCEVVAVDAEMDSFFSYQTKLCLIQISSESEDALIDPLAPLDLSPLRRIFENPGITKILHAADNDVPYLVERVGGRVEPVFDTHSAARILGLPKASLGGLLEEFLGLHVDKKYQRADWRVRPLPPEQEDYARGDTHYLIEIYRILEKMLREQGLETEAAAYFARTNQNPPARRQLNPLGYLNLPDARKLSRFHKARLRDLFAWRDARARQLDEAVFRIMPDGLMVPLALYDGADLAAHFRHSTVRACAQEILQVLTGAAQRPWEEEEVSATTLPDLRGKQLQRFDKLRKWRNGLALKLECEPERVIPNRQLKALVLASPRTPEALRAVPGLEGWRLEKFGDLLWEQVRGLW